MVRGITRFKCNGCGNKFKWLDIEWNATVYTAPARCPKCGSMHTYPVGLFSIFGPHPIYVNIWKTIDKQSTSDK